MPFQILDCFCPVVEMGHVLCLCETAQRFLTPRHLLHLSWLAFAEQIHLMKKIYLPNFCFSCKVIYEVLKSYMETQC